MVRFSASAVVLASLAFAGPAVAAPRLVFSSYPGDPSWERGKAAARAATEEGEIPTDDRLETADYDLNGDGRNEILVRFADASWCGTAGCRTLIFSDASGTWRQIAEFHADDVDVTTARRNGWAVLLVDGKRRFAAGGRYPN